MSGVRRLWYRYDRTVWIRVLGTVLTTVAGFMIRPFLSLYLFDKMNGDLLITALIIGLQPATGLIAGLYAGGLADRYGRKPVMVAAALIEAISIFGFIWADSILAFALLTILNGLCGSLFFPAASAQVADVVPEEKRAEVFALLHTALNVGAACGPLIGVAIYKVNPGIAFTICACAFLLNALLIMWQIPETLPPEVRAKALEAKRNPAVKTPRLKIREHKLLFYMTAATLPVSLLYTQVESIFPQHLKTMFSTDYLDVFATLMTINGAMVVLCQIVIARFSEKFPIQRVILIAYLLLACTAIGYAWSNAFLLFVVAEILFTFGEMMNGPQMQKAISVMAPPELMGRYFAVFGANWGICGAVGPLIGAFAFQHLGGNWWYTIISVLLVLAAILQSRNAKRALTGTKTAAVVQEKKDLPALS
ncbi:MFS transporter [Tumebacillus sp. ITR2]|uniref:MFS transporter n=1 Tax=Tumebacillus amylolyticus TaxID=2801339 RepID=A0ABS1JB59_9BACL|nr:MFS transporter [Tumebacillus amylolyticus]MBL0387494.1 MFS transporter [Tumebacillus amylolyticus]